VESPAFQEREGRVARKRELDSQGLVAAGLTLYLYRPLYLSFDVAFPFVHCLSLTRTDLVSHPAACTTCYFSA
jgi:hypothetical protein